MISYYTANLAAFLTFERVALDFNTAEELANHPRIKYSCLRDGSTRNFFKAHIYTHSHTHVLQQLSASGAQNTSYLLMIDGFIILLIVQYKE